MVLTWRFQKRLPLIFLTVLSCSFFFAQKDRTKYALFNVNNDVVIVYKSGTVALFSNPDLELIVEVNPGDRKNVATSCKMTSSGKYLVVNDNKADVWMVYDATTLEVLNRMDREWIYLPQFVGADMIFLDKKILTLPDLEIVEDISRHDADYDGFAFSPSLKTYINYEIDGTGGEGKFRIYDTESGDILGNSQVDETPNPIDSDHFILGSTRYLDENNVAVVYQSIDPYSDHFQKIFPVNMGKNYELRARPEAYLPEAKIRYDYNLEIIVMDEYAIDLEGDSELKGRTVARTVSNDNRFAIIGTPKNKLNLYENLPDSELIPASGDYKKSTLLKSLVVPAEK